MLRTVSATEGATFHYRLESEDELEIVGRIIEIRKEARAYGGTVCATAPHRMPNGQYRSAVWLDPS